MVASLRQGSGAGVGQLVLRRPPHRPRTSGPSRPPTMPCSSPTAPRWRRSTTPGTRRCTTCPPAATPRFTGRCAPAIGFAPTWCSSARPRRTASGSSRSWWSSAWPSGDPGWRRTKLRDYCRGELLSHEDYIRAYAGASVAVNVACAGRGRGSRRARAPAGGCSSSRPSACPRWSRSTPTSTAHFREGSEILVARAAPASSGRSPPRRCTTGPGPSRWRLARGSGRWPSTPTCIASPCCCRRSSGVGAPVRWPTAVGCRLGVLRASARPAARPSPGTPGTSAGTPPAIT